MNRRQNQAVEEFLWDYLRHDFNEPDKKRTGWGVKSLDGLIESVETIAGMKEKDTDNLKDIRNVVLFGRQWVRKGSGSVYCSVSIYVDGVCVTHLENLNGGSGNQYLYHAFDYLEREGYFAVRDRKNGGIEPPWQTALRIGFTLAYEVAEVIREKEL